jgi:hypothetical protein
MSGSVSPLALQLLASQGQQGPPPNIPQGTGGVPLSSLMAPNAAAIQQQNPNLPWYAAPGMFRPPPAPPATAAATAAPAANPAGGVDLNTLLGNLSGSGLPQQNLLNLIYGTPALQSQLTPAQGGGPQPTPPQMGTG